MNIDTKFKEFCLSVCAIVIKKFFQKEFKSDLEERLNLEATFMKVAIEKTREFLASNDSKSPIKLSEDIIIYASIKDLVLLDTNAFLYEKKDTLNEIDYYDIYTDWSVRYSSKAEETIPKEGIEKYLNTSDSYFNYNAYFWHIELRNRHLFDNIETAFKILATYLDFKNYIKTPISAIDLVDKRMNEHLLTKEQRLFIYDKLGGLIINAEPQVRDRLSLINIELLDRRWAIEPLNIEGELNLIDVDQMLEDANQYEKIEDRILFLRRKKLELEKEVVEDEFGVIQEVIEELQIIIDSLVDKSNKERGEILSKQYFDRHFQGINDKSQEIIDVFRSFEDAIEETLIALSEQGFKAMEAIIDEIESKREVYFDSIEEEERFFSKSEKLVDVNESKADVNIKGWQNSELRQKIKVVLPLLLIKYEAEMDVSKFSLPKSWKEIKDWFINE